MTRDPRSIAQSERAALADALLAAGPGSPTLCEGWTALDLAAHVVVRERRVDSLPGLMGGPFAGHTEAVRRRAMRSGLPGLVDAIRSGPPGWSPFGLPGVDARANEMEMLVHHEDVRRATGGGPRVHAEGPDNGVDDGLDRLDEAAWAAVSSAFGRLRFGRAGVAVTLRRVGRGTDPADPAARVLAECAAGKARTPGESVTIAGAPVELLLYAFGRRQAAVVAVGGSVSAVARLAGADFGV